MVTPHCFVIAEAGVNHNGSLDLARQLVEVAAKAGADAVKFQTFSADRLAAPEAKTASYQAKQTGDDTQHKMLKRLELPDAWHVELRDYSQSLGIEFMSTPFDEIAADFLLKLGVQRFKIPSGELSNLPFIRHLASSGLPLLISTGMATLDEVAAAVDCVREARSQAHIKTAMSDYVSLLHCTSNYPTAPQDVNLRAMQTLQTTFGLPTGYSDHTAGILIAPAAVALGATVIEKHFTLDRSLPGPDHQASLEPEELALMIRHIREIELSMGDGIKAPRPTEIAVREVVRKSIAASHDLAAGQVLNAADLILLRPGTGIPPAELEHIIGKRLQRGLKAKQLLQASDIL